MYADFFYIYELINFHLIYVYTQSAARYYVCNRPQHLLNHVDRGVNTPLSHEHECNTAPDNVSYMYLAG